MALGFHEAQVRVILGVDNNPLAVQTFKVAKEAKLADIQEPLALPETNIVFGSVPGAGVSMLNAKARGHDTGDPRNEVPYHFAKQALTCHPDAIVLDLLPSMVKTPAFMQARALIEAHGYRTQVAEVDAADYGVPQRRKHAILVAMRQGQPAFPLPTHLFQHQTVKDAIGDLPVEAAKQDFAFPRNPDAVSLERYKVILPGECWQQLKARRPDITPQCWLDRESGGTDIFGRLMWDKPSLKIRTEFYKPEKGRYLHPAAHRPLTHREACRLQTFPDWYEIKGTMAGAGILIGNAVPPRFAKAVAEAVVEELARAGVSGRG